MSSELPSENDLRSWSGDPRAVGEALSRIRYHATRLLTPDGDTAADRQALRAALDELVHLVPGLVAPACAAAPWSPATLSAWVAYAHQQLHALPRPARRC